MNYLKYILIASVCLGLFYMVYGIIIRKGIGFRHARIYLITSVLLSLLIPTSSYKIETGFKWPVHKNEKVILYVNEIQPVDQPAEKPGPWTNLMNSDPFLLIFWGYLIISGIFLTRILVIILLLTIRYRKSYKVHLSDCVLLYNHGFRNTLSFFRWIFVQSGTSDDEDLEHIIAHEKIHVYQLHSLDILLIELLTAVMWFNPFIWMMKNSLQLVHEYLADDGALRTGINRFKYQALLINQIAEERIVVLSSRFNHSLIKKRITMMTKAESQRKSLIKLLALLPAATLIFLMMALFNGIFSEKSQASDPGSFSSVSATYEFTSDQSTVPPDTIIKKTIIKKISKENPNDTIIEEKEEIITGEDVVKERKAMSHSSSHSHVTVIDDDEEISHSHDGARREVRIRSVGDDNRRDERITHSSSVHVTDGDTVIEEINEDGDSVKHVKIITKHGGSEKDVQDEVLYIIDGEKMTDIKAIEILDPDEIESMSVIKEDDSIKQYTDKDYRGVIVITTKKGKK